MEVGVEIVLFQGMLCICLLIREKDVYFNQTTVMYTSLCQVPMNHREENSCHASPVILELKA